MAQPTPSPASHDPIDSTGLDNYSNPMASQADGSRLSTNLQHQLDAPLRVHVERVVREYFLALGDDMPTDLYELILREVELPLLTVTLEQTCGNQSKCAQILGLNRGTLRKKMKTYNLMP